MNELDTRNEQELVEAYEVADQFVKKKYLSDLASLEIVPISEEIQALTIQESVRLFKLNRIVYNNQENNLDKLGNIYNALQNVGSSLIMLIDSDGNHLDYYIGVKIHDLSTSVGAVKNTLEKSLKGNFPGSDFKNLNNSKILNLIEQITSPTYTSTERSVSAVSGIPSLKANSKEQFVQGMEKLIDAMQGEKFSAIFIADPISTKQIEEIRLGYEKLYSQLVPFARTDLSFSQSDSHAITDSLTKGFSETINESISQTQSYVRGESYSNTYGTSQSKNIIKTTFSQLFGGDISSNESNGKGGNTSESKGSSQTTGKSNSQTMQEGKSETLTIGKTQNLQIKFENKSVTSLLEHIEKQLERMKNCEDFGMWNTSVYFVADNAQVSSIAASTYKAIMRGENSSVENAYINTWNQDQKQCLVQFKEYLKKFHHPLFYSKNKENMNLPYVTPGTLISGSELAIQCGLPTKSVNGLPVLEMTEFGRNIISYDSDADQKKITVGNIFHMGQAEDTEVALNVESLAMHTFITGATGTGKSNTVYKLLEELQKKEISFLVVEPAKGEYKGIFGGKKGVHVFGTNEKYTELLKINPFKFPEEIHILEHIDRLIEIFNASWPMYAAMPAVLKEAIEKTYEYKGWNLEESICYEEVAQFPTFKDLLRVLPEVIHESAYSEEVKNNYIGALVTRVKSMTNGMLGKIFSSFEIENHVLFDENCIIDLSRIGSMETKSLLMGIVFMKLQEYRMSNSGGVNLPLKHVTVLEEAHHLLRRTSFDQNQEGSNLQGKSVEMISNAIAEMRTYGEGFIIADQAPNMMDLSAIRNTNTKIILKLPDEQDRQTVGKAANLSQEQINELAKLKTGVAAIYQNNWLQPILCAVDHFTSTYPFVYSKDIMREKQDNRQKRKELLKFLLYTRVVEIERIDLSTVDIENMKQWLVQQPIEYREKKILIDNIEMYEQRGSMPLWQQESFEALSKVVSSLIEPERCIQNIKSALNFKEFGEGFAKALNHYVSFNDEEESYIKALMQCLLQEKAQESEGFKDLYFKWVEYERGGYIA